MISILRALASVLLFLLSPVLLAIAAAAFAIEDVCFALFGAQRPIQNSAARNRSATVVIPNWNGRDLLECFLPSVIEALGGNPANEILIVDNASTDGSAELLAQNFPAVRVLRLNENLGFAGGSNAGFQEARNDIVVLLNNDMRVEPDFLAPLLAPFADPLVFSVSCQIFFSDATKRREETGLTESWWERGRLRVSHRADHSIRQPFPCAYPGGGSSAFDRNKFLELGGFDELYRPFYYEDTDLGHLACKRGWKVLYQPASVVYHEHRGTIGKNFSGDFIERVLEKNVVLYCWKNIHNWRMLVAHFAVSCFSNFGGVARAFMQLNGAMRSRWHAHRLAAIPDREAFLRQRGGYFRDRFDAAVISATDRLNVLFLAPYPIEPPVHGGAVFMRQTITALAPLVNLHLISFVDNASQLPQQEHLRPYCASAQFFVRHLVPPRNPSTLMPHAIREFADPEFEWAVQRAIYCERIDVLQIDYTIMGQYAGDYRHIPCMLFEHDIFFQSLWRGMRATKFTRVGILEYLRMLRYELRLLPRFTRVQVCSAENKAYLLQFLPRLKHRIDPHLRAIIDTNAYRFVPHGRKPDSVLFAGSFRHSPNVDALNWFIAQVWPRVLASLPQAQLIIVGADPPDSVKRLAGPSNISLAGFVADIREPLARYAVFVCPILSGSGVRVKLLEAFASGIPVVSTTVGAEGLASESGDLCELADSPEHFAGSVVRLLTDQTYASGLAERARLMVEREKDARSMTRGLAVLYQEEVAAVRPKPALAAQAVLAPHSGVWPSNVS